MTRRNADNESGKTVAVVGLGNIGSQFIDYLGRMAGVVKAVLVDQDVYESKNMKSQKIARGDIGCSKVLAQARRLRAINPALEVIPINDDLANVPMALFRADAIVAGLDSVEARIRLNEIAWHLDVPWIDGGIEPVQRLVRVTSFRAGKSLPCFECGLDETDYQNLGTLHPCQVSRKGTPSTDGPAGLGGLTAALLACECETVLSGKRKAGLVGRQVVFQPAHHRYLASQLRRNSECRFNHEVWNVTKLPYLTCAHSLADLLDSAHRMFRSKAHLSVAVVNHPLVDALHCVRCGEAVRRTHLLGRIYLSCPYCRSRELQAAGFERIERIDETLPAGTLRRSLRSIGFKPGDVLSIQAENSECHVVIEHDAS